MSRYSRQIQLKGFGLEAQQKLADAKVLVIGAGGLGCPVITYLASVGMGTLGIVDHDRVEESNLPRQPIYTLKDVGRLKTEGAAERAQAIRPELKINVFSEKLAKDNVFNIMQGYDLILDCTDNFPSRYLINDACVIMGKPWIFAAGEGWGGQVSSFNWVNKEGKRGPTYRCLFPELPEEALNCNEMGVVGTLPGIIGTIQANEAVKVITGVGEPLSGKLLSFDFLSNSFHTFSFPRNEKAAAITYLQEAYELAEACEPDTRLEINVEELGPDRKNYNPIDIREEYEWEELLPGTENIPLNRLLENPELLQKKNKYVLICENGIRSRIVVKNLREKAGLSNVYSLKGGAKALHS